MSFGGIQVGTQTLVNEGHDSSSQVGKQKISSVWGTFLICGLILIIIFILIKTIGAFRQLSKEPKAGMGRQSASQVLYSQTQKIPKTSYSRVSDRHFGAWLPGSIDPKEIHEPLIDRATKLVEDSASRNFRFTGAQHT